MFVPQTLRNYTCDVAFTSLSLSTTPHPLPLSHPLDILKVPV